MAGAGDVNGDGYADVIVGAPATTRASYEGAAFVFLGARPGSATALPRRGGTVEVDQQASVAYFGSSVAGAAT